MEDEEFSRGEVPGEYDRDSEELGCHILESGESQDIDQEEKEKIAQEEADESGRETSSPRVAPAQYLTYAVR